MAGPPAGLLSRIRWFFLAFGLFFLLTHVPQLALESDRPWAVRGVGIALLLGLGAWWLWGHRRGQFPAWGILLESSAFAAVLLIPRDPFGGLGLLYIAVNFRSLYGSAWRTAGYTAVAVGVFLTASVAAPHLGSVDRTAMLGYVLPGIPPLAVIAHLVAAASARAERSAAREGLLSRTGLAIARAGDGEAARREALTAVTALLAEAPKASTRRRTDGSGASGDPPPALNEEITAHLRTLDVTTLPEEIRSALSVIGAQLELALSNAALTEHLRFEAYRDPLTGLANRRALDEHLARWSHGDWPGCLGIVLLDLDGFKQVNDTLGHEAGDLLLTGIAERLRAQLRDADLIARLGGDEFAVVVGGAADLVALRAVGERLLAEARRPLEIQGVAVRVSASVGIAAAGGPTDPAGLLRDADQAMYEAKNGGKNQVRVRVPATAAEGGGGPHRAM